MIELAQIGIGYWGKNLLRNFLAIPDVRIRIGIDKDKNRCEELKTIYPEIEFSQEPELAFNLSVDGVIIASPAVTHYELAKNALNAGKHVFVEKPLTLSLKDAEELLKLSKEKKKILMVGHLLLYHPSIRFIKGLIDKKIIGDLVYINSVRVNLGRVRKDENALWSLCAHDISVILYFFDKFPERVSATGQAFINPEIEDIVFLTLFFPEKKIAHTHASWLDPNKVREVTIVGTEKMIVFNDMEPTDKVKIYDKGVIKDIARGDIAVRYGDIHIPKVPIEEPLKLECQQFVDCIKLGKTPITDGENGVKVIKILEAAQKSLKMDGKPVEI